MKLYFAPLEGITGSIYRNTYEELYGGIDKYFAPFIAPCEKYSMIPKEHRDLLPENNSSLYLVPQVLTNKSVLFNAALKELQSFGYKEVNLNLGCPSGTVCAKGKGAGFLKEPDNLKSFLEDIYDYGENNGLQISIKTRIGYSDPDEFYRLLELFNIFPVSELIIHPRIKSDLYKGVPRYEYYSYAISNAKMPLVYNGNVFAEADYNYVCSKVNSRIDTLMLGRGIISNPSLAAELKDGNKEFDYELFWKFHDSIYHEYQKIMSPDINVLYKMKELWTYWRSSFDGIDKEIKGLLKTKKFLEYEAYIQKIKNTLE